MLFFVCKKKLRIKHTNVSAYFCKKNQRKTKLETSEIGYLQWQRDELEGMEKDLSKYIIIYSFDYTKILIMFYILEK